MFVLITSFKLTESEERNFELLYCLEMNLKNPLIDHVFIFTEGELPESICNHPKLRIRNILTKPTYYLLLNFINDYLPNETICLTNADIFFDDTLKYITNEYLDSGFVFCLTRWNYDLTSKTSYFMNVGCSFDTYIFKAPLFALPALHFSVGTPGCDNRLTREFYNIGLKTINPSKLIKSYHVHSSGIRNYSENDRLDGDYLSIEPSETIEFNPANLYFGK